MKKSHDALVPNGFGDRGVQGKILAATYVRSNGVSYLGIWLGMQLAVVEFARNVSETHMGGTMRLGGRKILL